MSCYKEAFEHKSKAMEKVQLMKRVKGKNLRGGEVRVYECPICEMYHITSTSKKKWEGK